ncbi:MAG: hypothetical protein JWO92_340 [Chitinophagaceae bacterium]|nr:hypothetical protein [Chitinophagaceae bacterium]MDB5222364.1 hypothetical protein [Chitinophagaceae bacterium]
MENKPNKPLDNAHDQPPQDETTKNKIDKHLSDIHDTISEEDLQNINTSTGAAAPGDNAHDKTEADEILKKDNTDDDEPEKEAPTPWEILGE